MKQITHWLAPNAPAFRSQYGIVTSLEWLSHEMARLTRDGRRASIIERNGHYALAVQP